MKLFHALKAAIPRIQTSASSHVPPATSMAPVAHTDATDCRILLRCGCGYSTRVSSPLGAFMSGWRKILWEEQHAQCWLCDREQRVRQMEES